MSALRLYATHTPSYDEFATVTVGLVGPGVSMSKELTPDEARAHAAEVLRAVEVVERDREGR